MLADRLLTLYVYAVDNTRGIDILCYTGTGTDGLYTGTNQRGAGRG